MITERDIAEKFSVIWKQEFPLLTSNFMRVFNESQIETINKLSVPVREEVRYDLISEASFNLAEKILDKNTTAKKYLTTENNLLELITNTAKEIWKSGNYSETDLTLNQYEFDDIIKITNNIAEFIQIIKKEKSQFKPKLVGYSFIPDLIADLSIDDTLFEIKTVNRNFKSSDLKQLFLYLALQQVSGEIKWNHAGLYNPRRGTYCKFNIKSLVYSLSGGKSPNEAFDNLLNNLVRDVKIDSRF